MIIGISGKIGSGKDTVGKIIQYLTRNMEMITYNYEEFIDCYNHNYHKPSFDIKKYAGKLKQIISILTGYSVEDLEKEEVKNTKLGEAWTKYGYADGFTKDNNGNVTMLSVPCSKERYEKELAINWQTAYKKEYTVRELLQEVGTEALRNVIHPNIWVNALFVDYKVKHQYWISKADYDIETKGKCNPSEDYYPNWIITDMRFPNELQAVKDRSGITIRINRGNQVFNEALPSHTSETALDNAKFNYIIDNNDSIEDLIKKVKSILINEKII